MALDEQSFQSLLAAAFTIQQHNDQMLRSRLESSSPESLSLATLPEVASGSPLNEAPESLPDSAFKFSADAAAEFSRDAVSSTSIGEPASTTVCEKCGAPKLFPDSPCVECAQLLRPGERLQRNWASMWMMSQEQNGWLASSADSTADSPDNFEDAVNGPSRPAGSHAAPVPSRSGLAKSDTRNGSRNGRKRFDPAVPESASNALLNPRPNPRPEEDTENDSRAAMQSKTCEAADDATATIESNSIESISPDPIETLHESTPEDLAREESNFALQAAALEIEPNTPPNHPSVPNAGLSTLSPWSWQQLADFRVILSFHRADLYLTLAVVVAFVALVWPVAGSSRPGTLSTWQRTLISLGIAEAAPPPVAHYQGDPSVQVWIDSHTGTYYCPGAEQYGKTTDGRYSTQRDARMDSFEAAGRSVCE